MQSNTKCYNENEIKALPKGLYKNHQLILQGSKKGLKDASLTGWQVLEELRSS